jgi:RimJ/RimL family protein N-acetyltransferase
VIRRHAPEQPTIETDRLLLRPAREADRPASAAIFADPEVRRFSLGILDRKAADARLDRAVVELAEHGFGMFAVEDRRDGSFIGMLGLTAFGTTLRAAIPSHPDIQIAWQLARHVWGQGLAPEGARAVLDHAFAELGVLEIVAITSAINRPSRRVMEKIGMRHAPADDFLHPDLPEGHRLRPHVLYRITR